MNVIAVVLRAVQLARAAGLSVTFEPGWETRGNGQTAAYVGAIEHHTAARSSLDNPFPSRWVLRDGRPDLAGPNANSAGPADGSIHIVAAHPANHAGASGGRSMGPLPVTTIFNKFVWGHEIDYAGVVPMLPTQYRAAVIWTWCLLTALHEAGQIRAVDEERARAHAETSITGKWDPGYAPGKTIDMAAFRASVATATWEDDMQLTELIEFRPVQVDGQPRSLFDAANQGRADAMTIIATQAAHTAALAAITADKDITPEQMAAVINGSIDKAVATHTPTAEQVAAAQRPFLEEVVREALGEDNTEQADAIVAALAKRLGAS